jgi:hypothetical protein
MDATDPGIAPAAVEGLADTVVAATYVDAFLEAFPTVAAVGLVAAQASRFHAEGSESAGTRYLLARVADLRGDVKAWRAELEASLSLDAEFAPTLYERGFLAFIEGDAQRANQLLKSTATRPR